MKYKLTLLISLIYISSFAQLSLLQGNWISDDHETISIADTINRSNYLINNDLLLDEFYLQIKSDTLSFQQNYYSRENDEAILKKSHFDFKIIENNDSLLVVKAITKDAQNFFNKTGELKFKRQNLIKSHNIKFEKLIFHTSTCYGYCPIIHLQITADKKIKLNAHFYNFGDSQQEIKEKSGSFTGEFSDETYEVFIDLLFKSRIDTYNLTNEQLCCDGSVKTIITYFDHKKYVIETMFEPEILRNLVLFLYDIHSKATLVKTDEVLDIEGDEIDFIN